MLKLSGQLLDVLPFCESCTNPIVTLGQLSKSGIKFASISYGVGFTE